MRRRSRKRKKNSLLVPSLCIDGGAIVIVALIGTLIASGTFNRIGLGDPLGIHNNNLNETTFLELKFGSTLTEIESILGESYQPTSDDFDLICGNGEMKFINPFWKDRPIWVDYTERGQIRCWSNGRARLLVFFHKETGQNGRMIRKIYRTESGQTTSLAGNPMEILAMDQPGFRPNVAGLPKNVNPPPSPGITPEKKTGPIRADFTFTVDELIQEFLDDEQTARNQLIGKVVRISGRIDAIAVSAITMKRTTGKGQVEGRLRTGALVRFDKNVGDSIVLIGKVEGFSFNRSIPFARPTVLLNNQCDFE